MAINRLSQQLTKTELDSRTTKNSLMSPNRKADYYQLR